MLDPRYLTLRLGLRLSYVAFTSRMIGIFTPHSTRGSIPSRDQLRKKGSILSRNHLRNRVMSVRKQDTATASVGSKQAVMTSVLHMVTLVLQEWRPQGQAARTLGARVGAWYNTCQRLTVIGCHFLQGSLLGDFW